MSALSNKMVELVLYISYIYQYLYCDHIFELIFKLQKYLGCTTFY
jgi:hypothetical protein